MQQTAGLQQLVTSQLPRFKFNGDNRLVFLSNFPEVAAHFGFAALLGDPPRARPLPAGDGSNDDEIDEWDRLNTLALSKLKFYLEDNVYHIVWKGQRLTAKQFYTRLHSMFLAGDMRSIQMLEDALNNCSKKSSETLVQWWARLDAILAEFEQIGMQKQDLEKKARAMYLEHRRRLCDNGRIARRE